MNLTKALADHSGRRVLLEAPISINCVKVAKALRENHGMMPDFWIGPWKGGSLEEFPDCVHYYAWDAFNLTDAPMLEEINSDANYWSATENIFESMTKDEYFTFLYMLNRQDSAASLGFMERDRFMKQHLIYWSNLLRKRRIDLVLNSNTPHLPYAYALHLSAKSLGIPTLFLNPTPHEDLYYLENEIGQKQPIKIPWPIVEAETAIKMAEKAAFAKVDRGEGEPLYMVLQKQSVRSFRKRITRSLLGGMLLRLFKNYKRLGKPGVTLLSEDKRRTIKGIGPLLHSRDGLLQTPRKDLRQARFRRRVLREFKSQELVCTLPKEQKFIFLPLHYQPELTSVPLGGKYADQIYIAELLRDLMPKEWRLLIKEHWSQTSVRMYGDQGRYPGYYSELARLPGTDLIDLDVDSGPFIESAQAVATVTGTAGWEALTMGVPCLLFGKAWYRRCPGVQIVEDQAGLETALKTITKSFRPDVGEVRKWFQEFASELLFFPVRGSDLTDSDVENVAANLAHGLSSNSAGS
jgi:hypothetical protein